MVRPFVCNVIMLSDAYMPTLYGTVELLFGQGTSITGLIKVSYKQKQSNCRTRNHKQLLLSQLMDSPSTPVHV